MHKICFKHLYSMVKFMQPVFEFALIAQSMIIAFDSIVYFIYVGP